MSKDNKNIKFDFSWEKFFAKCNAGCQDCQRMYAIQNEHPINLEGTSSSSKALMEHCYIIIGKAECYKNHKSMCDKNICSNAEKLIQIWKNNTLMHADKNGLLFQEWLLKTNLQSNIGY